MTYNSFFKLLNKNNITIECIGYAKPSGNGRDMMAHNGRAYSIAKQYKLINKDGNVLTLLWDDITCEGCNSPSYGFAWAIRKEDEPLYDAKKHYDPTIVWWYSHCCRKSMKQSVEMLMDRLNSLKFI